MNDGKETVFILRQRLPTHQANPISAILMKLYLPTVSRALNVSRGMMSVFRQEQMNMDKKLKSKQKKPA